MKRFLAPILLLTFLFPSFAYGDGLICKVTGWNCPEVVDYKDLVKREGLYYKKFTDFLFTGKVTGNTRGSIKDGNWDSPYVSYIYYDNGQLSSKSTYKDGKQDAPWVSYYFDGSIDFKGTFKDGKKISD